MDYEPDDPTVPREDEITARGEYNNKMHQAPNVRLLINLTEGEPRNE